LFSCASSPRYSDSSSPSLLSSSLFILTLPIPLLHLHCYRLLLFSLAFIGTVLLFSFFFSYILSHFSPSSASYFSSSLLIPLSSLFLFMCSFTHL
jgi:hypothetical protein